MKTEPIPQTPFPVVAPTRVPKERYYDQGFYDLEAERLWPRVWQMACRVEHIPGPGDYHVYDIGGRSLLIVRTEPMADASFPDRRARRRPGTAMAAMIPMMATTMSSSMRVNPSCFCSFFTARSP